jgi:hypothetical protein
MRGVGSFNRRELPTNEYTFKTKSQVCNILDSSLLGFAKWSRKATTAAQTNGPCHSQKLRTLCNNVTRPPPYLADFKLRQTFFGRQAWKRGFPVTREVHAQIRPVNVVQVGANPGELRKKRRKKACWIATNCCFSAVWGGSGKFYQIWFPACRARALPAELQAAPTQ